MHQCTGKSAECSSHTTQSVNTVCFGTCIELFIMLFSVSVIFLLPRPTVRDKVNLKMAIKASKTGTCVLASAEWDEGGCYNAFQCVYSQCKSRPQRGCWERSLEGSPAGVAMLHVTAITISAGGYTYIMGIYRTFLGLAFVLCVL
jgi:hypothetical protein